MLMSSGCFRITYYSRENATKSATILNYRGNTAYKIKYKCEKLKIGFFHPLYFSHSTLLLKKDGCLTYIGISNFNESWLMEKEEYKSKAKCQSW